MGNKAGRRALSGLLAGIWLMMGLVISAPSTVMAATIPTIAGSGVAAAVKAGSTGVVDGGITLQNFDTIDGATVAINGGFVASEDQLSFTNQNGINGSYNSTTGVLTLSGTASAATYQAALRSVQFRNTNPNSTSVGARTVTFSVGAGTLYNQATGHFYQYIAYSGISWSNAQTAAAARSLYGLRGYLATITSKAENDFVTAKLQGTGWIGASDLAKEGEWRWVTGPEAGTLFSYQNKLSYNTCAANTAFGVNGQYANWAGGEPNDCGSYYPGNHAEDYAHFYTNGTWNDYPGNAGVQGYVVEYGGMAGDSQPVLSANATVNVTEGIPPVTTVSASPTQQNGSVAVTLRATDNVTPVPSTYYRIDNGSTQTGTALVITGAGTHSLTFWSIDAAGNEETPRTVQISVDPTTSVPTVTAQTTASGFTGPAAQLSGTAEPGSQVAIYLDAAPTSANLALNKPVTQSSWYDLVGHPGSGAVDGVITGSWSAHTANGAAPWWQVDLGQSARLDNLVIWNRNDCCGNRENTLSVLLSADGANWTKIYTRDGTPFGGLDPNGSGQWVATMNESTGPAGGLVGPLKLYLKGATARFVRLQVQNSNQSPLNFDELQAFGTAASPVATVTADAQGNWAHLLENLSNGDHTVRVVAYGPSGASAQSAPLSLKVDAELPTITGVASPEPNPMGWNNSDVVVEFTCSDGSGSGIDACTPYRLLDSEGADQSATGGATDNVGNVASATVSGINIDKTAPTSTASLSGQTGTNGWYVGPVTVNLSATDNLSGVRSVSYRVDGAAETDGTSVTVAADGQHTVGFSAMDLAGNGWRPVVVDSTHRLWQDTGIDVPAGATLFANFSGSIMWDYRRPESATGPDGASGFPYSGFVPAARFSSLVGRIGDGPGFQMGSNYQGTVAGGGRLYLGVNDCDCFGDNVGGWQGTIAIGGSVSFHIDGTAPTITGSADRPANSEGWYNAPVTFTFTCTDATSGIFGCSAPKTFDAEGANQSFTAITADKAGNHAEFTVSGVNLDKTAPVTTLTAPGTWQNQDVPVTLAAMDNLSGVSATYYKVDGGAQQSGTSFTLSAEGTHTITYWSVDAAGNAEAAKTATVQIDKTAPTITGSADRAANGAGWYNASVTVSFVCADALSGVASCSGPTTLGEGASQSVSGTAADNAGNTASTVVSGINIDTTAPTISGAADRTANGAGWYNGDVTVSFTCGDALSGVAACAQPQTLGEGASQSATGSAADQAGNTASATVSGINIDKTAPTISGAADRTANGAGWYNGDVTVSFTCGDALSGVAACAQPQTLSEGASQSVSGSAADKAGNTASATVSGINVDKTAPTISGAADRTANGAGWYNGDVTVSFTCGDALSGVAACAQPQTLGEGASQSATGSAADKAGNTASATVSGINIDKTAPTISGAPDRAANGAGWYNADVTINFTCGDNLSGVAACAQPQTLGEGASQSVSGSAADNAGNTASTTVSGISIDKTAPTVTYSGNAGTYSVDQQVNIFCAAADSLSGVASTDCANVTGPAYSFALGQNSFSASAMDRAGNGTQSTVAFTVTVSNGSLCGLTQQFVSNKGIANSLCSKLDNAAKQAAAGKTGPSNNMLDAFVNEVQAQAGKALTFEQAEILTRLAGALRR